jgi:hypothetical protein
MVELEAVGAILVCKSLHGLVGTEHSHELLMHFEDLLLCEEEVPITWASSSVGLKEFPVREPKS